MRFYSSPRGMQKKVDTVNCKDDPVRFPGEVKSTGMSCLRLFAMNRVSIK